MKYLISSLLKNTAKCFSIKNLRWHALMIVLTYIIVATGFDWLYYLSSRNNILHNILFPAVPLGGIMPIFGIPAFILVTKIYKNKKMNLASWALAQAAFLGLIISSTYKAFTGRIPPAHASSLIDTSHGFQFGFMEGGIFWGWPSSHTTVAFAMAFALINMYPENKILRYVSILYALYIGLGISISIHWLSEFVAGAILGAVIGTVVGKSFKSSVYNY